MAMRYCPECKTEYQDEVTTCPIHGRPLGIREMHQDPGSGGTKCPKPGCGAISPAGAAFCSRCGTKLEPRCPKCSAVVRDSETYCPTCGARVAVSESDGGTDQSALTPRPPVTLSFLQNPPDAPPSNSFDPFLPDSRLMRHSLNLLFLQLCRRYQLGTEAADETLSPATVQALVQAVDSHINSLAQDPNANAAAFLPHATQAAAMWLSWMLHLDTNAFGTDAVKGWPLPNRYRELLAYPSSFVFLTQSLVFGVYLGLFWGGGAFRSVEAAFENNLAAFSDVVCQSLRELFYLTYPTVGLKERFLSEETFKLNHGYYPDSIRQPVAQLLGKLRAVSQKLAQEIAKIPGGERNYLLVNISPLSIPMIAASLSLQCRDLTEAEQHAFDIFASQGLDTAFGGDELLTFLVNMRNEQDANAANVPVQNPIYIQFETAHYYLTRYCNALGPRIPGRQYRELPHRALRVPGMSWNAMMQAWAKSDPELASALFPQCKTIEMISADLRNARAAASPAQATTTDTLRANLHLFPTDKGGRHTPIFPGYKPAMLQLGSKTGWTFDAELIGFERVNPGQSRTVSIRYLESGYPPKDAAWAALKKGDRLTMFEETEEDASEPELAALGGKEVAKVGELEII